MHKSISTQKSKQLKIKLKEYVESVILPHLNQQVNLFFSKDMIDIQLSDNAEKLRFYYPSVLNEGADYLLDHVLIEFGIKNTTAPCNAHKIIPLLSQVNHSLSFNLPEANINVLSPIRTFWEKATLIHVECNRGRLRESPDRLSRHWYDLTMLTKTWVGKEPLPVLTISYMSFPF